MSGAAISTAVGAGDTAQSPRIPLLDSDSSLSAEQRDVLEAVVAGPRGRLVGPLRAALHNPVLADRWQRLGETLRYRTSLPKRLSELAILVVARHWNSDLEWAVHVAEAVEAGLDAAMIDAVRRRSAPTSAPAEEAEVYEFARQMLAHGSVGDAVYAAVQARWNAVGVVELVALIGYYTMVAMTLNAHHIPLPADIASDLPGTEAGIVPLPTIDITQRG
jgi:4-carboxymuconolactone decarboxylase